MPITPLFAAIFGLMYVLLSVAVIRQRLANKVSLGTGESRDLEKAIRIHGNFAEYVPLSLILMWFLETITFSHTMVFVMGCVLLLGRIVHVIGILDGSSYIILRQLGTLVTFGVIIVSSIALIWHYIPIS